MAVGIDDDVVEGQRLVPGQRIEFGDRFDLVAEHLEAPGTVLVMGREQVDRVAAHAKSAALESIVVALVLLLDEAAEQGGAVELLALVQAEGHRLVVLQRTDAVDAGDRSDDDDVVAFHQRARCGVTHPVDLLVDRRILLDEGVGARHVGFGLVVVVIRHEVFDGVLREEPFHLGIELRSQRLVGRHHQRRAALARDDVGHGEGLARAGDAQQHLVALARLDAGDELLDRCGLVAGRRVIRHELEGLGRDAFELRSPLDVRHQERDGWNRKIL